MLDAGQSLGSHGAPRKPIGPWSRVKGTRDKNTREKGTANDIFLGGTSNRKVEVRTRRECSVPRFFTMIG